MLSKYSVLYLVEDLVFLFQEAQQEVNDIMRSSASEVKPGNAFYNGAFVKPGGHLVQRQVQDRVSFV